MNPPLPAGYELRRGSGLDRALLVQFMQRTYEELFPGQPIAERSRNGVAHLAQTVDSYLSADTPLWWVAAPDRTTAAGLWIGNAIDQVTGDRHAHIFLLYVTPAHRRRGIGKALMQYAENWARQRGDRQIGLQVFQTNQPALHLYTKLGYEVQSLWMVKSLDERSSEADRRST
ncbi:GNAT family N-acetyltransferase [Microcoleus sp. FACHB-1515]|uniref:GNAT family N-acetyltransferase n=1 Tax=Cyanophyceae TaxID=3028117 RepID=UPI00168581D9|nr:GNAT family N-acetyltransferase [Microcoleus sp. FACHB-1515]MBD2089427.1 GNAT family N-acetyltransferase [Microcoleus sp. FACHB-1515]